MFLLMGSDQFERRIPLATYAEPSLTSLVPSRVIESGGDQVCLVGGNLTDGDVSTPIIVHLGEYEMNHDRYRGEQGMARSSAQGRCQEWVMVFQLHSL